MTKIKLQIKNRWTGSVLFKYEKENNTIKETLIEAVKKGADLYGACLRGADLYGVCLYGADLRDADLRGACLRDADLRDAKEVPYISFACPSDGAFVGWKKVKSLSSAYLVKLEIPEDARRCSATTQKCRCDKAKVLDIIEIGNEDRHINKITNTSNIELLYKVGTMVYPDSFDENRWNECSHGIHFFINKQDAINYGL